MILPVRVQAKQQQSLLWLLLVISIALETWLLLLSACWGNQLKVDQGIIDQV